MKLFIEKNPGRRITENERKRRAGKGYVYHRSHQPFIKVRLLLKNLEGEPELYVNKIQKRLYHIERLISFLKTFEKTKQNIAYIHGAALVGPEGRGYIIAAQQDVGKTALTLMLTNKNQYSIIGDDTFDLSSDGTIYRNQEVMGIFPHPENLKELNLSVREKIAALIKRLIFVYPPFSHLIYPNLRVSYSKLKRVTDEAKLEKVFLIEKGKSSIEKIEVEEAARKIMSTSLDLAIPGGFAHRMFYMYTFFNNISPVCVEEKYKEIIPAAIRGKETVLIRGGSPQDFYKLFVEYEKGRYRKS